MPNTPLHADSLSYKVRDTTLVHDVSFTALPGEVLAIVGPNGAGKSTLLSLLAGDLKPEAGSVHYAEEDVTLMSESQRALERAVLSQRTPLDIPFTASSVVRLGRFPHRHDSEVSPEDDAQIVTDSMEMTDTLHLYNRVYATLSGGERTRVALARVLAQDTPIILLDEPTTALDIHHQERVLHILGTAASAGRTVIAVLHDLNGAATYADRLLIMADTEVRSSGTVDEVLDPDVLSDVYNQPLAVIDHPLREGKLVLPYDATRP